MTAPARIDPETVPLDPGRRPTNWQADVGNRRFPKPTQWDYPHMRRLLRDMRAVLPNLAPPGALVLDFYCGARPYADLLAPGTRSIGLDVFDKFGMADIVTSEFLPFTDASFDAAMSTQAFGYVPDPVAGVAELRRVLKPGAPLVITLDFVWEYDRATLEHRFTGPGLARLFEGWDDVRVFEQGGRGRNWARLTNRLVESAVDRALARRPAVGGALGHLAPFFYVPVNALGESIDRIDRGHRTSGATLPPNLMLLARRPSD